jgi:D-isomer specific 2-hydroxyacid dehydrogenase, NAD binding domain
VPFEEVLRTATVLVICCPRDASTVDLIAEEELRSMRKEAVVINVARGGIVNETALAKARKAGSPPPLRMCWRGSPGGGGQRHCYRWRGRCRT